MTINAGASSRAAFAGLMRRGILAFRPTHFDKQVRAGTIPAPLQLFGVNVWDRAALDALFDGVSQAENDNDDYWDKACGSENLNM